MSDVKFNFQGIDPPASLYFGPDDNFFVLARNSVASQTVRVAGRFLEPNGKIVPFQTDFIPATDRSGSALIIALGEGFLLNLTITGVVGSPRRGQLYVVVTQLRGAGVSGVLSNILTSGYVTVNKPLMWPGSPPESNTADRGFLRSITGTNPAAGVEISETVPTSARWILRGFSASLVTNITAANRNVRLLIDDGTNSLAEFPLNVAITASLTAPVFFVSQFSSSGLSFGGDFFGPISGDLEMAAGWRVRTVTQNLQAGDDWGAPQLYVEEFIES